MTKVTIEAENDQLLEQLLAMGEPAPEPGTLRPREIIHRGDDDVPAPVIAAALESAGYVYIYDTRTGERSLTNRNMLPTQLKKRREDGTPVFTTIRSAMQPARGTHRCLLHPDHPDRAKWDALALPACRKANLTSPHEVRLHMQHRHRREWEVIEEERKRQAQEEERAFQRAIIDAAKSASAKR